MNEFMTHFVATAWTPIFVAIFLSILGYALWPKNQKQFDEAASMPLRED